MCSVSLRLEILAKVPFFQDLSLSDLESINPLFQEKDYIVDDVICLEGEPAEQLFVIAEGRVRLLRHSLAGKDILLELLTSGEFFGSLTSLGNDVYPDTAQAQSPACVLTIGKESFRQILDSHPSVAMKVIDIMSARLQAANERVHQLSVLPVEGRIANTLLILGDKFGSRHKVGLLIQVPLSRDDLAGMTGTTTETASRVMSAFRKDGLIRTGRGWVALTDLERLEAVSGNELD